MKGYVDSSVVIRKLLRQPGELAEWSQLQVIFSSRLLRLETLRTIDRLRLLNALTNEATAVYRKQCYQLLEHVGLLPVSPPVIDRSEEPFATPLGSLDSLHLATALLWRERAGFDFVFATHDTELGLAAKAHGFTVIGV